MKNIRFTITIQGKEYRGYLQCDSITVPPKFFFVFMDNYIVGNLLCTDVWNFQPVGWHFKKLTEKEKKEVAEYLGNIAVLGYESLFFN